jgi:hypothetical protein
MAGRGRGATLPAWMTSSGSEENINQYDSGAAPAAPVAGQYDNYAPDPRHAPSYGAPVQSYGNGSRDVERTVGSKRSLSRSMLVYFFVISCTFLLLYNNL